MRLSPCAEAGGRADGVAERAVEGRGVLGGVGQDQHLLEAVARPAPGARSPIRPSIMSDGAITSQPAAACTSGLLAQGLQRFVVDHVAVAHQPVLAVAGVRVQGHVADHADRVAVGRLDRPHRAADEVLRIERLLGLRRLLLTAAWPGNRATAGMPNALAWPDRLDQQIDRQPFHARHRRDRLPAGSCPRARTPARSSR